MIPALHNTITYFCSIQDTGSVAANDVVTLQRVFPVSGPACPGQNVVVTCTAWSSNVFAVLPPILVWTYNDFEIHYGLLGVITRSPNNSVFSAVFSTFGPVVFSNATINDVTLSQHNSVITCQTDPDSITSTSIQMSINVTGIVTPPSNLTLISNNKHTRLTWLPPSNEPNCSFNYTVNITNTASVVNQMHSNITSLMIPTDLMHGETYSFAVAVTDRAGQHGPWSEELRVKWDGMYV